MNPAPCNAWKRRASRVRGMLDLTRSAGGGGPPAGEAGTKVDVGTF